MKWYVQSALVIAALTLLRYGIVGAVFTFLVAWVVLAIVDTIVVQTRGGQRGAEKEVMKPAANEKPPQVE
jgi:hypothetical protein